MRASACEAVSRIGEHAGTVAEFVPISSESSGCKPVAGWEWRRSRANPARRCRLVDLYSVQRTRRFPATVRGSQPPGLPCFVYAADDGRGLRESSQQEWSSNDLLIAPSLARPRFHRGRNPLLARRPGRRCSGGRSLRRRDDFADSATDATSPARTPPTRRPRHTDGPRAAASGADSDPGDGGRRDGPAAAALRRDQDEVATVPIETTATLVHAPSSRPARGLSKVAFGVLAGHALRAQRPGLDRPRRPHGQLDLIGGCCLSRPSASGADRATSSSSTFRWRERLPRRPTASASTLLNYGTTSPRHPPVPLPFGGRRRQRADDARAGRRRGARSGAGRGRREGQARARPRRYRRGRLSALRRGALVDKQKTHDMVQDAIDGESVTRQRGDAVARRHRTRLTFCWGSSGCDRAVSPVR